MQSTLQDKENRYFHFCRYRTKQGTEETVIVKLLYLLIREISSH